MSDLLNVINASVLTGTSYVSSVDTSGSLSSRLLTSSSESSFSGGLNLLDSNYSTSFTAGESSTVINSIDSGTMQAILQATQYTLNTNIYSALNSDNTSLYEDSLALLDTIYTAEYSTES